MKKLIHIFLFCFPMLLVAQETPKNWTVDGYMKSLQGLYFLKDPLLGDPLLVEMMHGTPTMPHSDMMMHSKDPGHGGDPLMDAVAHKKGMMMLGSRVAPGRVLEPPETPESNSRKSLGVLEFPPEKLVPMI